MAMKSPSMMGFGFGEPCPLNEWGDFHWTDRHESEKCKKNVGVLEWCVTWLGIGMVRKLCRLHIFKKKKLWQKWCGISELTPEALLCHGPYSLSLKSSSSDPVIRVNCSVITISLLKKHSITYHTQPASTSRDSGAKKARPHNARIAQN